MGLTQIIIDFREAYDSGEIYTTLSESGVSMKLVRLTKMCLNKTCSKVHIGKYLTHFLFSMV
jgi:hypothetical protein